jgi:hypothetical protein
VGAQDTQCQAIDRCGDNLDNDCNGTADDSQCVTCQDTEICGDGVDNDCDGQVDGDDLACQIIIR